jgi:flagellar biosynthetic protein FliR
VINVLIVTFALVLARIGTFLLVLPLLGGPNVPHMVKIGFALSLAILFFEVRADLPTTSVTWFFFAMALGREILLGGLFGFALSFFLLPARIAGALIAQEAGLTYANVVTASGDGSTNSISALLEMLASLVFFALDLHHIFLLVLEESFRSYPIGARFVLPKWDLISAASAAQEGGVLLAAPVALCLFLTTVVLAMMTRAAPQLNLYSVGFPLRVLVSLGAMLLLIPSMLTGMIGLFSYFVEMLQLRG